MQCLRVETGSYDNTPIHTRIYHFCSQNNTFLIDGVNDIVTAVGTRYIVSVLWYACAN